MLSNRERAEGGLAVTLLIGRIVRALSLALILIVAIVAVLHRDKPDIIFQIAGSVAALLTINLVFWLLERLFRNLVS